MKVFTIDKGKHYSNCLKVKPHILKKNIKHKISFDENSSYNLESNDQMDINKLFGISYGFHHKNSARFGWRWDLKKNKMEILAYVYNKGKRIKEWEEDIFIAHIELLDFYEMEIQTHKKYYKFIIKKESNGETYETTVKHGKTCFWGYELFPYFGGNRKAPHDITIAFN
jgi:hypothetical protein